MMSVSHSGGLYSDPEIVQFIQVYLEDPDLPLPSGEVTNIAPDDKHISDKDLTAQTERLHSPLHDRSMEQHDTEKQNGDTTASPTRAGHMGRPADELADPSSFEDFEQPLSNSNPHEPNVSQPSSSPTAANLSTTESHKTQDPSLSRPRLEQSSLSWMLDKDSGGGESIGKHSSSSQNNSRNRGFLFGDAPGDSTSGSKDRNLSRSSGKKSNNLAAEDRDEVFDLGSLRHAGNKNA